MIDPSRFAILIDGAEATARIESCQREGHLYLVKFKGSNKAYRYTGKRLTWLSRPTQTDLANCHLYVRGHKTDRAKAALAFSCGYDTFWHIIWPDGQVSYLRNEQVVVRSSCLANEKTLGVFNYLKDVAALNPLGCDDPANTEGLLAKAYHDIKFIDDHCAAAPYLSADYPIRAAQRGALIFPFGCNASQRDAVARAFERQISIIQGPPGTGKTQTILNIIANIVLRGQTVLVVSNNNSATANVREKLEKAGFGFLVAALGKKENKEAFLEQQPAVPDELTHWLLDAAQRQEKREEVAETLERLGRVFELQEALAQAKNERQAAELEKAHFLEREGTPTSMSIRRRTSAKRLLDLWLRVERYADTAGSAPSGGRGKFIAAARWWAIKLAASLAIRPHTQIRKDNLPALMTGLRHGYYDKRIEELDARILSLHEELKTYDSQAEQEKLTRLSTTLFKDALAQKFHPGERRQFESLAELSMDPQAVLHEYPVILSTAFSSRSTLSTETTFDYLIMDEASQVSIETGVLALTCAHQAVIVGDTLQLPHVVTGEDREKLAAIAAAHHIPERYDCARSSFLQSVCESLPQAPQTLLREHYRCHPSIINFCNQKFYGGNLLIMTDTPDDPHTMWAIRTNAGHHSRGHYNQREIDVIREEVLPQVTDRTDVGIITPYRAQAEELQKQLPGIEAATVHKFQGREKDTIIMSVTDDLITEFSDNPNLLNVAVSRAKKQFCIVLSGNKQKLERNISDLVSYIDYHNFTVTESKVHSIFDYLYEQYTRQRMAFLKRHDKVSAYDSENLTYGLLQDILRRHAEFSYLTVVCHVPLRDIIRDTSFMDDAEREYAKKWSTHVDFLLVNRASKQPELVVETDGYAFHREKSAQHRRDQMKDHIFASYRIPVLRLSTVGSGEEEKIIEALRNL